MCYFDREKIKGLYCIHWVTVFSWEPILYLSFSSRLKNRWCIDFIDDSAVFFSANVVAFDYVLEHFTCMNFQISVH